MGLRLFYSSCDSCAFLRLMIRIFFAAIFVVVCAVAINGQDDPTAFRKRRYSFAWRGSSV